MKLLTTSNGPSSPNGQLLTPLIQARLQAERNLRAFQTKHEKIFTELSKLQETCEVTENELRTAAKVYKASVDTPEMLVEYVMPQHRYYSPTTLRKLVPVDILVALDVIQTTEVVDEKALKALVRAGKIKKSVLTKSLITEDTGSPRVTIKIKDLTHAESE